MIVFFNDDEESKVILRELDKLFNNHEIEAISHRKVERDGVTRYFFSNEYTHISDEAIDKLLNGDDDET